MIYYRQTQLFFVILLPAVFLLAACGEQSSGNIEADNPKITEPEKSRPKPSEIIPVDSPEDESQKKRAIMDVDWGREVNLDEIVAVAKKGRIVEMQRHVIPNILRSKTSDGGIFHLKNENKGFDLRNTFINASVNKCIGHNSQSRFQVFVNETVRLTL
jgi:hypothetical protein